MRGGAQSHLMRCDDGYYVVKFQNNPLHRRVLVNELLGTWPILPGALAPKLLGNRNLPQSPMWHKTMESPCTASSAVPCATQALSLFPWIISPCGWPGSSRWFS